MMIAWGVEWIGGVDGRLRLGDAKHETRSVVEFLGFIESNAATFDTGDLERIGICAYYAAVCEVRSTTAGFVLAAADQIIDPVTRVSSDDSSNAAIQAGIAKLRSFLMRIRAQPGGTLADAARGYLKATGS